MSSNSFSLTKYVFPIVENKLLTSFTNLLSSLKAMVVTPCLIKQGVEGIARIKEAPLKYFSK